MRQRIGRRLISIMLSVLMLVSLLPTAVFAEELQNQTTAGVTEQVGGETGNTVKNSNENEGSTGGEEAKGESSTTYVAKVGDKEYATLGEAIVAAEDKGTIILNAESYDGAELSSLSNTNKAVTIKAAEGVTPTFDMPKEYGKYVAIHNATVTFEGITFKYGNADYVGLAHAADLTYNSCTIEGKVSLYAKSETFNNCTFNQTISDYNVWTYGAMNVEFNDCIFNNAGKTVNVYIEKGNASAEVKSIKAEDCTVNSSADDKAFLNIKNASQSYDVTFTGTNTVKIDGAEVADKLYQVEQTAYSEDNKTTLTVKEEKNGVLETVYEVKAPVVNYIDLDTFIKWLESSNYSVDGASYTDNANAVVGGKLVVKWSPVSGCYDTREGHECTVGNVTATGNTPLKVNSGLAQFSMLSGVANVTVKNVRFVYEAAGFTICANSGWACSKTKDDVKTAQLYLQNSGNTAIEGCEFDNVVFTSFDNTGSTTIASCQFKNIYDAYAIKDLGGSSVSVTGSTFEDCGGGVMLNSNKARNASASVTITGNTFKNVDVAGTAAANKVGTRGLIQVANTGDYTNTGYDFSNNNASNCGPVLRQLNESVKLDSNSNNELKGLVAAGSASGLYVDGSVVQAPDGYVEEANGNVTISDEEGLIWFAKQVNEGNTFAGKTVALANNITLTKTWKPIGDFASDKAFKGTFDGQNHTVSGMQVTKYSTSGVGFFAKTFTATIKNLTVEGKITAYGCNYVGGIVGHGYATITNCTFKGTVTNQRGYQVGGIAGSGGFTITNCAVYGDISAESWVGGIVGNAQDGGAFTDCYVEGTISANSAYAGASAAGIAAIPLYKTQKIGGCYSNTVVKCGGEEINAPIIGAYNEAGVTADTELFIYDNSWNKAKNPNVSYEIKDGETVIEGKDVSRDNNLVMLEDDLKYVTDLSKVRIMAGSAVTQAQVDALAVASIGTAKYISLAAAIAAAKPGATVKLLADTRENVTIAKAMILDLNGFTLNGGTEKGKPALTITARIVRIKDSSKAQTGTIMREDTAENSGVSSHYVIDVQDNGWVIFESGTVKNGSGAGGTKGASLVRVGDDSVAKNPGLVINGGTFTQDNFIVIKVDRGYLNLNGGTLKSANSYAVENWFNANIKGGTVNGAVSSWTYSAGSNSTLTISGGTVNGDVTSVNYGSTKDKVAKVSITGGTVNG